MKLLKGYMRTWRVTERYLWKIEIPGRVTIVGNDSYASNKSATTSAKRFAARCNIELEQGK